MIGSILAITFVHNNYYTIQHSTEMFYNNIIFY